MASFVPATTSQHPIFTSVGDRCDVANNVEHVSFRLFTVFMFCGEERGGWNGVGNSSSLGRIAGVEFFQGNVFLQYQQQKQQQLLCFVLLLLHTRTLCRAEGELHLFMLPALDVTYLFM